MILLYTEYFLYYIWHTEVAANLFGWVVLFLIGKMKPIEVRGCILAILLGRFIHAVVYYVPQDDRHIQGDNDGPKPEIM